MKLSNYHYLAGRSFKGEHYHWHSLSEGSFLNLLSLVPFTPTKFVDIGSGLGDKLWLTSQVFPNIQLTGIECDKCSVTKSKQLLKKHKVPATILHQDIVDYNYGGPRNVFYTYGPRVSLVVTITHKVLTELDIDSTFIQVCGTGIWHPVVFTRVTQCKVKVTLCGVLGKAMETFYTSRVSLLQFLSDLKNTQANSLNSLIHILRIANP